MIAVGAQAVWLQVGSRIQGMLRKRGANSWTAEDIAQETLARAVAHDVDFDDADDLMRWCVTVACNLHVDLVRRQRWDDDAALPEAAAPHDVEREVLAKLELRKVVDLFAQLSEADQGAIRASLQPVPSQLERKEAVGEAVRRHRARVRLARLVAAAGAALGWCWSRRLPAAARPGLVTALPALTLTGLAIGISPFIATTQVPDALQISGSTASELPDRRLARGSSAVAPAPDNDAGRAASKHAPPVPRARTVDAALPTGNRLRVGTTDRPSDGVLVCVYTVWVLPDTCLAPLATEQDAVAMTVEVRGP